MSRTINLCKKRLGKAMAYFLCFIMCFTYIPWMDNSGATVEASETLKLGDYIQMGTYYEVPIIWRCVAFYKVDKDGNVDLDDTSDTYKEGYLPLMLSDKILCLKAFDANGNVTTNNSSHGRSSTSNSIKGYYRQLYGSNCWEDSNIRCWLNSTASTSNVKWDCGNKPDNSHVWLKKNEYDQEAGFLSNFTQSEINCMKTVSQYQLLDRFEYEPMSGNGITGTTYHSRDSGISTCVTNFADAYKKKITDTMFLLDVKQVNKVYQNSAKLGDDYYIGKPTDKCVTKSTYTDSSLATSKKWNYWLRSPCTTSSTGPNVFFISSGGAVSNDKAYYGKFGVRPAFFLDLSSTSFETGAGSDVSPYVIGKNANSWTTTPAIANVTYGTEINPEGLSKYGTKTISYKGTGGTSYDSTDPPTNAGTYKATFAVAETDTYLGLTTDVEFTIAKANPSYSVPTGLKATTGKILATISLPSGFTWQEAITTSVGSAGTKTFHVKYTPSDTSNYNVVENIEVSVTVTDSSGILAIFKKIFSFLPNLLKSLFSIFK